jgi:pimeloyl-ACP methyl ester carboxylesterase
MTLDLPDPKTADIDGPVVYREWDGPPDTTFVVVHGLGGSQLNWVQVAPALAGLGRVLAPDLPGFGRSPRAGRSTRLMDERRWLSTFIAKLATGRVVVAGNSMGGAIAMLQAAVDPASVAGVVLTGSVFPWSRGGFPHPLVLSGFAAYDLPVVGERLVDVRSRRLRAERVVPFGFRMVTADPSAIPPEIVRMTIDLFEDRSTDPDATPAFLDAWRSMVRLGRRRDIATRAMDAIACPVLVLHGRRDRLVPVGFAEAALRANPSWRGRLFPDLGHVPQMEAPGRWITEVADWFPSLER